jgi:hypothetical protein
MVPEYLAREAALHFTLRSSEEDILKKLANTEKVVLVAACVRAMRTKTCPEVVVDEKIRALSGKKVSKRDLIKELVQLVTLTSIPPPVLNLLTGRRAGDR